MTFMTIEQMRQELTRCTVEQLLACKSILEFNLSGVFLGDRAGVILRLSLIGEELEARKNTPEGERI